MKGMLLVELQALIELYYAASVCVSLSFVQHNMYILWLKFGCKRNDLVANLTTIFS